jgi:hypothetical protein
MGDAERTMRRLGLGFLLLLGCFSVARGEPWSAPVSCEREEECLAQLGGLAKRDGNVLSLMLENGSSETYRDNHQACEDGVASDCVKYELRAYRPDQNLFVVSYALYEGGGAVVVSAKSGRRVVLTNLPVFSPNGLLFAVADSDPHYERRYEIGIWSFVSDRPKEEFVYSTPRGVTEEMWEVLSWSGNDRVELKAGISNDFFQTPQEFETSVVRTKQGWTLNWPLPNSK